MEVWKLNVCFRQRPKWTGQSQFTRNDSATWHNKWWNVYHFRNHTRRFTQQFSPKQMDYVTELIRINTWSLMLKRGRNSLTLIMLIPAAQYKIYEINLSRIPRTIIDTKFLVCLDTVHGISLFTIRGFWKSVRKRLLSNYVPTHKLPESRLE